RRPRGPAGPAGSRRCATGRGCLPPSESCIGSAWASLSSSGRIIGSGERTAGGSAGLLQVADQAKQLAGSRRAGSSGLQRGGRRRQRSAADIGGSPLERVSVAADG